MLNVSYTDHACEYKKVGSIPDGTIAWPQKSDFNLSETSFTNFSATSLKSYIWRESTWTYSNAVDQTSITWNVSASSGKQSILELPLEITSVHPVLSFNNLKHYSTIFYTQSPAFEAIVDSDFESIQDPDGVQLGVRLITK